MLRYINLLIIAALILHYIKGMDEILFQAYKNVDLKTIQEYQKEGYNFNHEQYLSTKDVPRDDLDLVLFTATLLNNGPLIQYLLPRADVRMALQGALQGRNFELATVLIERYKIEIYPLLENAAFNGQQDIVKFLLNTGQVHPSLFGRLMFELASRNGNRSIMKLLIEHGANVASVVQNAIKTKVDLEMIKFLIQEKDTPEVIKSALSTARGHRRPDVEQYLLSLVTERFADEVLGEGNLSKLQELKVYVDVAQVLEKIIRQNITVKEDVLKFVVVNTYLPKLGKLLSMAEEAGRLDIANLITLELNS